MGSKSSWSSMVSVVRLEVVEAGEVESVLCEGAGEESVDLTCEAESEVQGFDAERVVGACGSVPCTVAVGARDGWLTFPGADFVLPLALVVETALEALLALFALWGAPTVSFGFATGAITEFGEGTTELAVDAVGRATLDHAAGETRLADLANLSASLFDSSSAKRSSSSSVISAAPIHHHHIHVFQQY